MELDLYHDSLECHKCRKTGQLVSHGFVYKNGHNGAKIVAGKRIFCSNRNGRNGCGSTFQIYLTVIIQALVYNTSQLSIFLDALAAGGSIQKSYKMATDTEDPRNAYRWLHKLYRNLIDYRGFLKTRTEVENANFKLRTKRFQILLPTIQRLFLNLDISPCAHYQILSQKNFI